MLPHVIAARYVREYVLWLRFDDGAEGEIDLAYALQGPMFEPMKDREFFTRFQIHPELRTLTWPNGADFAPEFLRSGIDIGLTARGIGNPATQSSPNERD